MPKMNYDAFKEYTTFKKYYDKAIHAGAEGGKAKLSNADKLKMSQLNKKLTEEIILNQKIIERRQGETVQYGEELHLLHYESKSFLEGSKNCAEIDKSCNMVKLNAQGSKMVCFVVEPRYKYRNEGSPVNYGDVVVFRNLKSNQYLHISVRDIVKPKRRDINDIECKDDDAKFEPIVYTNIDRRMLPDEFAALYEVNTASSRSNFTIRPFRSYIEENAINTIKGGQVVRFLHSESGGYISSEDFDFTGDNLAEVFLWNYKGKSSDIEANSTQTYFELEIITDVDSGLGQKTQYSGNSSNDSLLSGGMHFRLRHLNTGRLVVLQEIEQEGVQILTLGLSEHLSMDIEIQQKGLLAKCNLKCTKPDFMIELEENSVFRLISTGVDMESGITVNTSVQIQHVSSGRFISHNPKYKFEVNQGEEEEGSVNKTNIEQDKKQQDQDEEVIGFAIKEEKLDEHYFKKVDDQYVNLGSREFLTLEENPSFENAFFIAPESRENLQKVMFVHTSVNCLNNFLYLIANKEYGQSREFQNKIENILKEMIQWISKDEDDEFGGESRIYVLDEPYSLKSNDQFDKKKSNLQIKQKYMREMRVIECIVQILYVPFACGAFEFKELKQDQAITSLLQLCYKLLSKIVDNNRLNEIYAAQWLGLYLYHVIWANDDNAVGADDFIGQLCDENQVILEKMITGEIIQNFIDECDPGKEAPRLLKLLTALCAIQSGPIVKIQNSIVNILTGQEEARNKLLMPLRRIKRRYEIEVCLDFGQDNWVKLIEVSNQYIKINKKMKKFEADTKLSQQDENFLINYECFCQSLELFAETTLCRNTENQKKIARYFDNKILIAIFKDDRMQNKIRKSSLKLYLEACLDIDPFMKQQVPSGLAVWKDLPILKFKGEDLINAIINKEIDYSIKTSKVRIPPRILELKEFMAQYLKQNCNGWDKDDLDKNEMILAVLKTVKFMLSHGFYQDQNELQIVASPIIQILNGVNIKKKIVLLDEQEEGASRQRYFPESPHEVESMCKCLASEILILISNLEVDAKCVIYLAKLKQDIEQIQDDPNTPTVSSQQDLELLQTISAIKGYEQLNESQYVCILFDLLLYRQNELQSKVFAMIVNYFTRKRIMMECLRSTQILESSKSIQTMNEIKKSHFSLKKQFSEIQFWLQKHNTAGTEAKEEVTQIFEQLTKLCILTEPPYKEIYKFEAEEHNIEATKDSRIIKQKSPEQQERKLLYKIEEFLLFDIDKNNSTPNKENQRLLQSFEFVDIALSIIKQRVDRITNYNEQYIDLISSCYRFLVAFVRGNFQNQLKVYDDIDVFMRDIDKFSVSTLLFYEIFKDNKKFLTLNVSKFIRAINNTAEEVSLSTPKKAVYLKLLEVFCRYEKQLIRQNQIEIIRNMTEDTTRSNVLYLFQAEGAKELSGHIESSLTIMQGGDSILQQSFKEADRSFNNFNSSVNKAQLTGLQVLVLPIFNVIKLVQLLTLCCEGKSDYCEQKCKEQILNFKMAANMIEMSKDLWPLKIEIFNYIVAAYMDSNDPDFMKKPEVDDQEEEEEVAENAVNDSDVATLLRLIEILNQDYEDFLEGNIRNTRLQMPNSVKIPMRSLNEEYIYTTGIAFIKATLKRKTYDVGSVELKFYVLAKNVAATFYVTQEKRHQLAVLDLLKYIYTSDKHAKYLDNVKHPAKKGRQNKEILESLNLYEETTFNHTQDVVAELTNSNRLSQRIIQLANSNEMKMMKEAEFSELVTWVTQINEKISKILGKSTENPYENLTFTTLIGAILRLLDSRVLSKELQIAGLSILRKIIEMENKDQATPSADWDTEDWIPVRRIIKVKQDFMVDRGTIQFLCKHISEVEDADIQEECILVCIALVLGGNKKSQETFYNYMRYEDTQNKFLLTIRTMLTRNFELTKKFMIEKNAKLDILHKLNQRQTKSEKVTVETLKQTVKQKIFGMFSRKKKEQVNQQEEISLIDEEITNQSEKEDLFSVDLEEEDDSEGEKVEKPISVEQLVENVKQNYLRMTIRILRFLQLLCEGQNSDLQNNLREQITQTGLKSARSFDFVAYVSNMFTIYVKSYVNCYSTNLGNQIIESMVEFIQGPCELSQSTLVDTKAIDCCRDLLNQGMGNQTELEIKGFGVARIHLLNDIKMNSVKLLLSILEGPVNPIISQRISDSLGDFQIVIKRMESIYFQFLKEELKLPADSPLWKIQTSLTKNSFDSCILEGFDIYSLINQLVEVILEDKHKLDNYLDKQFFQFYMTNSGNIEVNTDFDVLRIYFPLQPKCQYLTEKSKAYFERTVERESGQHKLLGLCEYIPSFIEEMEHLEIMSHQKIQITPSRLNYMKDLSTILAFMVGGVIIATYKYDYSENNDTSWLYQPVISYSANETIFIIGCVQAVTSFMLVVGYIVNNANLIVRAGWRERNSINDIEMLIEKKQLQTLRSGSLSELDVMKISVSEKRIILQIEGPYSPVFYNENTGQRNLGGLSIQFEYIWVSLTFLISDGEFIFNVLYFVFSIQGLLQSPVFYSFHLLDIINRFPALQNVIQAVTLNLNQILLTGMLGAIIIYNFSIFAFLFLQDDFFDGSIDTPQINKSGQSICMSLLHCYLTSIDYGLRFGGGIGDALGMTLQATWNAQDFYIRFFYDILFFLLITTIILNVVFGIIIDSFAQLREAAGFREEDMKNKCFMCNMDRYTLDRDTAEGFDFHTDKDHNLWNYVYFIIHLKQKDPSDFNGTESYINNLIDKENMSWFPQHKSLRMTHYLKQRKSHDTEEEAGILDEFEKSLFNFDEALGKLENQAD